MIGLKKLSAIGILLSLVFGSISIQGQSVQKVDTYLEKYLDRVPVPGFSVVIVEAGKVKFSKGYGVEKQGNPKPMTVNTTMAIGAMGRGFTAIAVMQLVDKGLLDLDVPVTTYLPWFKAANKEFSDQITMRMCLSNTTGIPPQFESLPDLENENSSEAFVRSFESHFIKRKPGMSHEFCDEGFVIAGLVISEITGMAYSDYVSKNVLKPLGMNNSAVNVSHLDQTKVVYGHEMGLERCYPAIKGTTEGNFIAAGSEFYSSATDLGRYMIALLNKGNYNGKRILSVDGIEELFKSNTSFQGLGTMLGGNGIDIQYALGWMGMNIEDRDIMIHTGNNGNVASIIGLNRDENQAFAMLFNADVNRLDRFEYPGMEFMVNNVIHIFNDEDTSDFGMMRLGIPNMNTFKLAKEKWSKYIGRYENFGKPNPFFKNINIEIFVGATGDLELIARQQKIFKGHYGLEFTNESRATLRNISFPRDIQFSIYPDGFVGGLFMFGSEFKKKNKSAAEQFVTITSPDDRLSFQLPKSVEFNWINGQLLVTIRQQEGINLILSVSQLKAQSFDDFVADHLSNQLVTTTGILNKSVLKKGIWIEQTVVVKEGDNYTQHFFAFYQDPVSNQQLQLILTNPWGQYSSELQQLVMQLQQSANFDGS